MISFYPSRRRVVIAAALVHPIAIVPDVSMMASIPISGHPDVAVSRCGNRFDTQRRRRDFQIDVYPGVRCERNRNSSKRSDAEPDQYRFVEFHKASSLALNKLAENSLRPVAPFFYDPFFNEQWVREWRILAAMQVGIFLPVSANQRHNRRRICIPRFHLSGRI